MLDREGSLRWLLGQLEVTAEGAKADAAAADAAATGAAAAAAAAGASIGPEGVAAREGEGWTRVEERAKTPRSAHNKQAGAGQNQGASTSRASPAPVGQPGQHHQEPWPGSEGPIGHAAAAAASAALSRAAEAASPALHVVQDIVHGVQHAAHEEAEAGRRYAQEGRAGAEHALQDMVELIEGAMESVAHTVRNLLPGQEELKQGLRTAVEATVAAANPHYTEPHPTISAEAGPAGPGKGQECASGGAKDAGHGHCTPVSRAGVHRHPTRSEADGAAREELEEVAREAHLVRS